MAEIEPTWAISLEVVVGLSLLQLFHQGCDSLVDAALQVHGVQASGHVLGAFAHDGLASTVAVVVPSPALSLVLKPLP